MTFGDQASDSYPRERQKWWHEWSCGASLRPGPLLPSPSQKQLPWAGTCPSRRSQHAPLPRLPQSNPAGGGQRLSPHLKRRNSELMFTFPVERQDGGEAGGCRAAAGGQSHPCS